MKPKKILLIGSYLPSLLNFRGDLIVALKADGFEVFVSAPDASNYPTEVERIKSLNVSFCEIPMARTGLNPFKDIKTLLAIRSVIKDYGITHLLVYTIKPVVYGLLATLGLGVKHKTALVTGLGYAFGEGNGFKFKIISFLARQLYVFSLACASRVIFQNPDDRNKFVSLGIVNNTKTRVVNGSGINIDLFKYAEPSPKSVIHFLFIARLITEKGIYQLIDATKRLKVSGFSVKVDVVGWIDDNPSAIKRADLDNWIEDGLINFHGKLTDVKPALQTCDVFVLPSYYPEGTPRTILESLAIGRAVITTDMPGCRETVQSGFNGFLIQPRDVDSLTNAMKAFLEDPSLVRSMGLASRRIAEEKYSVVKVNKDMLAYISE